MTLAGQRLAAVPVASLHRELLVEPNFVHEEVRRLQPRLDHEQPVIQMYREVC